MTFSLETVGIVCMWVVVILRLPQVIRDRGQRPLWSSVVLITVVTTLYMDAVQQALADLAGRYVTYLATHLVTVASAAAVLHFILVANGYRRYTPWLYAAATAVAGAILWIYIAAHPHNPRPGHAPELPLGYFVLVSGFNVVALALCAVVCGYGVRRVDHWALRWALLALALGWAANALPWLLNLAWLISHNPAWIALFSQIDGVSALGIAAGAALPLVPMVEQRVRHSVAYRRLGPLWQSLTDAFPQVRLIQSAMSRVVPMAGMRLPLYRRVVEIRDAMVLLRSYVSIEDVQAAQAHVERYAVPDDEVDACVTACWLAAALEHRRRGSAPAAQTENIASVGGDYFEQEVRFLLQVTGAYGGELARTYTIMGGRFVTFVQLIEYRTTQPDAVDELLSRWIAESGGQRTATRTRVGRDHHDAQHFVEILEFPSYDEAMHNSQLPVTHGIHEQFILLCTEPPRFVDLDIVREEQL